MGDYRVIYAGGILQHDGGKCIFGERRSARPRCLSYPTAGKHTVQQRKPYLATHGPIEDPKCED
jgi:hypothetical protein